MNKAITVIIPNWNGLLLLKECLLSLEKQTFKNFDVIVVDNASTDDSVSFIKKNFPDVQIIQLDKNYGFATAINAGVKVSQSEYIALLNNDAQADKDWLKELISCIRQYPDAVSVCSKLLNDSNRKKIDGVGILINEVGQAKSIGWEEMDTGQYNKEIEIFGATGGAALFRRDIFIKLGMFDSHYFMYGEEVDFAFRAQFQGYKSYFCPKAVVYHKHKATSGKRLDKVEYWQFKNMYLTIIKDFPLSILFKNWRWLKIILVYLNTILYQLKSGFIWPPFAVTFSLLIMLPYLIKERINIQSAKKVDDAVIEKFLLPKPVTFWGIRK